MSLENLELFFRWWLIVDLAFYLFTVFALFAFRDLAIRMQCKMMKIDEKTALSVTYGYVAVFKVLIIVFNFAPWLALLIVNSK